MKGLTRGQKKTLEFIVSYMQDNGIPPSYSEMSDGLGLKSKSRIYDHIYALKDRGYIDYAPKKARSITVLFSDKETPNWEHIARALYLQNRILRDFVKDRGWEASLPPMELP
jgi:SOS-response transcriptional repressor LexA